MTLSTHAYSWQIVQQHTRSMLLILLIIQVAMLPACSSFLSPSACGLASPGRHGNWGQWLHSHANEHTSLYLCAYVRT
ncbi:hypothetical protein F5Y10DRAFT_231589 [Nemania abortiva]|nr:hypothetical protein F5Y10DRAFT_231589 [Nemania abortiva]